MYHDSIQQITVSSITIGACEADGTDVYNVFTDANAMLPYTAFLYWYIATRPLRGMRDTHDKLLQEKMISAAKYVVGADINRHECQLQWNFLTEKHGKNVNLSVTFKVGPTGVKGYTTIQISHSLEAIRPRRVSANKEHVTEYLNSFAYKSTLPEFMETYSDGIAAGFLPKQAFLIWNEDATIQINDKASLIALKYPYYSARPEASYVHPIASILIRKHKINLLHTNEGVAIAPLVKRVAEVPNTLINEVILLLGSTSRNSYTDFGVTKHKGAE